MQSSCVTKKVIQCFTRERSGHPYVHAATRAAAEIQLLFILGTLQSRDMTWIGFTDVIVKRAGVHFPVILDCFEPAKVTQNTTEKCLENVNPENVPKPLPRHAAKTTAF
jgi:hypothetical protein